MYRSLILLTSFVAITDVAIARQPSPANPVVQVGIFSYSADGRGTSAAWDDEPSLSAMVFTNETLCRVGAYSRTQVPPPHATHAWRFSGTVVSKTTEEVVLRLTWQRLLQGGEPVAGPENVVQLTLRAGDTVPLETVVPESSQCSSVRAAFEARYLPHRGAVPTRVYSAQAGRSRSDGAAATQSLHVDLWLVHKAPGRDDEVLHQAVRAAQDKAEFAFPSVSIMTPQGAATVLVNGSFNVTADRQLSFLMTRRVSYAGQPASDVAHDISGSGRTLSRMPTPDEVVAFELPAIRRSRQEPPLPNQFSVRFKVTPIAP